MKSFTEYLLESKQTYEFKVKVAGKLPTDFPKKIKEALARYSVVNCSAGKSTPIQEMQIDFPEQQNISVTVFDVIVEYPTTSDEIRARIAETMKLAHSSIKVRNIKEEAELEINKPKVEQALGKDYDSTNNQELVGDKHIGSFLKELSKTPKKLQPYTGVHDQMYPKAKKEKEQTEQSRTTDKKGMTSTLGTKKVQLTPYAAKTKNSLNNPVKTKGK